MSTNSLVLNNIVRKRGEIKAALTLKLLLEMGHVGHDGRVDVVQPRPKSLGVVERLERPESSVVAASCCYSIQPNGNKRKTTVVYVIIVI